MCTVTWVHQPGGYHLFCNRDEKLTRATAHPPAIWEQDGTRYIAAIDPDLGGTWLAANEFGVSVCLLNGPPSGGIKTPCASRGLLVRDLTGAPSARACLRRLARRDLNQFASFTLLVVAPAVPTAVAQWMGRKLVVRRAGGALMPLTSSSYNTVDVCRSRIREFRVLTATSKRVDTDFLHRFHSSHSPARGPYSVCMHRADAETVSFSWVTVTRETVCFRYSPSAPCQRCPAERRILPRAA